MSIRCPRQQWRTTCDLCGDEAVQEIDELPDKWIAVIRGGNGSKVWTEETVYTSNNVRTTRTFAKASGWVERVICPNCQTKLGMTLTEMD